MSQQQIETIRNVRLMGKRATLAFNKEREQYEVYKSGSVGVYSKLWGTGDSETEALADAETQLEAYEDQARQR